ncbi:MAG: NAD(P)-dependent oxidoreductase [Kiritimatiellae bacterium]|nr:NAD(P)-dependent oxidoreductase [Kiritimatiellia bacterium]
MKKVLIPTKLEGIAREILEKHGGYQVVQDDKTGIAELAGKHPDCHALIVRSEKITPALINQLPALKAIVRAGSGYDTIDIKYARKKKIDVLNTPGANANAVAEEVIALMLADARHIIPADISARAGKWEKKKFMGRELTGKTIGIVGLGNIGQLVAKRLAGFEVRLLGFDPMISQEKADAIGVELVDLPGLFSAADYITLHIPENKETKGMINRNLLAGMKEGATLVNCARAGIIDEDALRKIKTEKKVRFLNDVYKKDEEGPKSAADIADIMLPHLGASTVEANTNAARRAAEELIELDEEGITTFVVNREVPEGLDEAYGKLAYTLTKLCRRLVGADTKLKTIETSFYGSLQPFGDWLMIPIVSALGNAIDERPNDYKEALQHLKEMGIAVNNRKTDPSKGFENSITIDLTASLDSGHLRRVSVRGTVTEGILMIARINDFDKLYFEPKGPTVFFIYEDRPGVLGQIGSMLAAANINIEDVRNPHHQKANQSLVIMRVNQPVPEQLMGEIAGNIKALASYYYDFGG